MFQFTRILLGCFYEGKEIFVSLRIYVHLNDEYVCEFQNVFAMEYMLLVFIPRRNEQETIQQ